MFVVILNSCITASLNSCFLKCGTSMVHTQLENKQYITRYSLLNNIVLPFAWPRNTSKEPPLSSSCKNDSLKKRHEISNTLDHSMKDGSWHKTSAIESAQQ